MQNCWTLLPLLKLTLKNSLSHSVFKKTLKLTHFVFKSTQALTHSKFEVTQKYVSLLYLFLRHRPDVTGSDTNCKE
jgi:hypothetical protein